MKQHMQAADSNERIGRLETAVEGIQSEFGEIRQTLSEIQRSLGKSKETNWSVVLMAVGLMITVWAAAIHPLQEEVKRQEHAQETLAQAVIVKDEKFGKLQEADMELKARLEAEAAKLAVVINQGSPITDRRLTLLEWRMEHGK